MIRLLLLFYFICVNIEATDNAGTIGQVCLKNEKKQCISPHSQCIEGICMCSSFYKYINGECVTEQSNTLGKPCRGGGDCRGQGEFCSSFSFCMCLSTHVDIGSQCKPVIYPGQFGCEDSLQCNKGFPGAECDVSRICVCPHGMFVNQQTCVLNDQHSSRNVVNNELMLQNVIMADHRQVNRSDFRGNFFRRKNFDSPRTYQVPPDGVCSYDNQCSGYPLSICDTVCKCVKGALNTGTTCIASATALQSSVLCPTGQTYIREAGVCMTVQQPGEPCQYSQQCSALEPGAYCLKMRCECVYGMKKSSNGCTFVNDDCKERGHIFISEIGECREVIPPGGKGCSHNLQCSGAYPDATCFMQTCTCPPNLPVAADGTCGRACPERQVYSGVTGECLPEVRPGEACLYSSQCQAVFGGMVCDKNTCRCPNGLYFDGLKCSQSCPPQRRIIEKDNCVERCSGNNVEVDGKCAPMVEIGQTCTSNAQCSRGSFCQQGSCLCPPGFFVVDNQCQAVEAEPNASCMNSEKCSKGSICQNGRCVCPRNQELINGYCQPNRAAARAYNTALNNIRRIRLKFASQPKAQNNPDNTENEDYDSSIVPIGSACVRVGVSCDGGSVCVAGICVCPLGKTPRNGMCIKHVTAHPGASCESGEECVENSVCNEDTWQCECVSPSQMIVGNRCVERLRSHPGFGCSMGEMCVGNSQCVNGKCACTNGKVEVNRICVDPVSAKLGEMCGEGNICEGSSYCNKDTNRCACQRGQKEIKGECRQVTLVQPGEVCTDVTSRCIGGSYCARGRCECPLSMQLVDKKCVIQQKANPGGACNDNVVCSGYSVCKSGICTCINDMIISDNYCVQKRRVNIGTACDERDKCMGNSSCIDNQCQCHFTQIAKNDECITMKKVAPGYLCETDDICTGQSVCMRGVCQCKPDYKQMHNICVKQNIGVEGSICANKEDCGNGLSCEKGLCGCPEGTFSINGKCRNYLSLGQTCTTDDRCSAQNSHCYENACTCKNGFVNIDGDCLAQIVTPAEPEVLSQVRSGLIGHLCVSDDACKVVNSHCYRNTCSCKSGYRIFGSTQCILRVTKTKTLRPLTSKLVNIGETCDKLSICQKGAVCSNGKCVCPHDFIEENEACVKNNAIMKVVVPPLASCLYGEICSGNSECVHGMCFCKDSYTLFHGKCQPLRLIENLKRVEQIRNLSKPLTTPVPTASTLPTSTVIITTPSTTTKTSRNTSLAIITTTPSSPPPPPPTTTTSSSTFTTTTTPSSSLTPIRVSIQLTPPPIPATTPNIFEKNWRIVVEPGRMCDSLHYCGYCSVCISGFCVCPEGLELHGDRCVSHIDAQRCVASNQCPAGANCVRGECKCKPGLGLSRMGFCIPINYADPGTSCSHGERCRSESTCIDGICVCNEPLLLKANKCIRSPREKRFISKYQQKILRFTPKKKAKLGEYCFRDDHCNNQKQCINYVCKCQKNFVQSAFSCVPRQSVISKLSMPGETCRNSFCVGGSTCVNSVCKCPGAYFKQGDTCVRIEARIGAPCGLTSTCSSGAQCVSSYCQCPEQYDANDDQCYPPNDFMVRSRNTKSFPKTRGRVVSASTVNCPIGYDLVNGMCVNSDTLSVIQLSAPGGSCEDGRVLCTGNSVCANSVCICPGGETVLNGTCISANSFAAPGDSCDSEITTCTGNSQCVDGICKCPNGYGALNGKCSNIENIGGCAQKQCGMNQICTQNVCQCKMGYYQQQESCVADRCDCIQQAVPNIISDVCERQCGINQVCIQDQCQCKQGYAQQTGSCIADRCNCIQDTTPNCIGSGCSVVVNSSPFFGLPGQMCDLRSDAVQCRNDAICVNNQCVCPTNRVISGATCVYYLGDAMPGQSCAGSGIICRGGSSCNQNVCQCQNGLSPNGERCVQVELRFTIAPAIAPAQVIAPYSVTAFELNPGQTCDTNCNLQPCLRRCSGGSSCTNSVCTCPQGNYVVNNACTPNYPVADNTITRTSKPGESCDNTVICTGGSSCVIGTCSCDLGYTPSFDRTSCVLIDRYSIKSRSYPKTFCKYDTECKGGTICVDKRCACRVNEEMIEGKCQQANLPGSRCHTSYCSNGAECQNGYCVCSKTHFSNSTLHCVQSNGVSESFNPGSKCEKTSVCQNNSQCLMGYCVISLDESDREQNINLIKPTKKRCTTYKDCLSSQTCSNDGYCECPFNTNYVNGECIAHNLVRRTYPPMSLRECPNDNSCKLPNCFCTTNGKIPPNNLDIKKVPQMVMLTFDDPVTDRIINTLKSLFSGKIRNPNGCAIKGTFFISHQWNNYDQSQWLYSKGNEIAVNSITRDDLSNRTKERWISEQKGMRDTLAEFSYVENSQIVGTRAPLFKIGGDVQFEMMKENNFTFDNSMQVNGLYWPQTLDHKLAWECDGKCPEQSHKGVWTIPIQYIQGNDGMWYNTMGQALKPSDSRISVKQMLMRNFLNNYKTNRAPFVLTLNTDFLTYLPDNGAIYALEDFLKEIVKKNDVYIVTGSQIIDWMRNPTETESIKNLRSWQCNFLLNDHVQPCESPSICSYDKREIGQLAHSFRICGSCPRKYPWI